MHLHVGLYLDGQQGWRWADALGAAVVGPLGLLDLLETQLGLLQAPVSRAQRIVQYRDCLQSRDDPGRCYHRSFHTDELGTAERLLAWRDEWHLHGWDGDFQGSAPRRLRDLAEVERAAVERLAPSLGERLQEVERALRGHTPPIACLTLLDPIEDFPKRWRDVLAHLPIRPAPASEAPGQGWLARLQGALRQLRSDATLAHLAYEADGGLTVVQAETAALAGRWAAAQLDGGDDLLVTAGPGGRLDEILATAGRARLGVSEPSAFRPPLQVLPLALEMLWEPLDLAVLLRFLTHPVCPLPRHARRRLAEALAERPGLGGPRWRAALAAIEADEIRFGQAPAARRTIAEWIEHERHAPVPGADLGTVIARVDRLAGFFQGRLAEAAPASGALDGAALEQCRAVSLALTDLAAQGMTHIRPRQLQLLVSQATARGCEHPLRHAEVGACRRVTHPGAAIEAADQVLWWPLAMPPLPGRQPWSRAEWAALRAAGADLPTTATLLEREARAWLRPLLAARRRLVLVLPPVGEEAHPVWQTVRALVPDVPVQPLEALLSEPAADRVGVAYQPLPARRRYWRFEADLTGLQRETESYSSLEPWLFNPYQWLLHYPARIRPSRLLALPDDFRLYGNLAHGLIERWFRRPALCLDDSAWKAWFDPAFDQIIAEEGALLRMPGRGSDLQGFKARLRRALDHLLRQLQQAGVVRVDPEQPLAGVYPGGSLAGSADLVLERQDGRRAILDLKWQGDRKYRDKLKSGGQLQLILYAELARQRFGMTPGLAYFILGQGRLLANADDWFPAAEVVPAERSESPGQLWQRFIDTWAWRREQLRQGLVEVALDAIEPLDDAGLNPPETGLRPTTLDPRYNDYVALAGWEA